MNAVNKTIYDLNELQKQHYVRDCEAALERQLDGAVEALFADGYVRVITLAGPTCSGKTTTANKIIHELQIRGKRVVIISIDDFFKSAESDIRDSFLTEKPKVDFDSVEAIDLDYFTECTEAIFAGKDCKLPRFDFTTGKRSGYCDLAADSYDTIIFEGIQAVYPEVTRLLEAHNYESIFTNVRRDITVNGIFFDKREIRLMRRLVRDYRSRNASPELTYFLWDSVTENEDKNILPYADQADIAIDSLLPYELHVLKAPLLEVLSQVEKGSEYYPRACEMMAKMANIPAFSADYIPEHSLYREFLG